MTHKRSGSVADIASMFETAANKQQPKPLQRVMARRHSMSKMWEDKFKIKQPELINGPRKQYLWNAINDDKKPKKTKTISSSGSRINHINWKKYNNSDSDSASIHTTKTKKDINIPIKVKPPTIKKITFKKNELYEFDDNVIDIVYQPEIYATELNDSYKAKIAELETEIKQHENKHAELNNKYDNLNEKNNGLFQELESVKIQFGELGTEIERLNESIADNATLYENEKQANESRINELNGKLDKERLVGEKEEVIAIATLGESAVDPLTFGNDEIENLRKENAELNEMLNYLQKSKIDLAMRTDEEMQRLRRMVLLTSQIYGDVTTKK